MFSPKNTTYPVADIYYLVHRHDSILASKPRELAPQEILAVLEEEPALLSIPVRFAYTPSQRGAIWSSTAPLTLWAEVFPKGFRVCTI